MDVATFSLFLLRILSACAALWLIGLDRIGLALNQLHYWLAARKPQLTYKPSKVNNRILESCSILDSLLCSRQFTFACMLIEDATRRQYRPQSLGCTNDVRESVVHIRQRIGARVVLIGVGFSLGANLLVKYLGEEGKNAQLTSAVSICNPYCCTTTHQLLTYSWLHRVVYNTILGKCMVKYFFKLSNAAEVHKDHPALDYDALRNKRLSVAKTHFATDIKHVAIPLPCLSSKDDPISSHTAIPYADCSINPNVVLAVTHTGDHMAFYTGNASPHMWVSDVVVNYVHATVKLSKEGMITPNLQTAQDGTALPKLSSVGTQVADHRTSHFA
ncbi:hypothetical protein Ae201684P_017818 [Aphanomyces euteiches]|nr:hypothetical protein Ae201684P_017818 [Aphanomyces euteiches]